MSELNTVNSRIARKPVGVPAGVDIKIENESIYIKGPKGNGTLPIHPFVDVKFADGHINVVSRKQSKKLVTGRNLKLYKSITGTVRANIANLVKGVTQGFEKRLLLVGVGYRAQSKGSVLALSLGFSHPTEYAVPAGVTIETPTQTEILIKGTDKKMIGLVAAQIRSIRSPEPYKGKGVRYSDEKVVIKETKKK